MYKLPIMCTSFLLIACTTDPVPDEEFEGPTASFPLLGTVPDRDTLPPSEDTSCQQKRLQQDRDQATQKQSEIIKSTK